MPIRRSSRLTASLALLVLAALPAPASAGTSKHPAPATVSATLDSSSTITTNFTEYHMAISTSVNGSAAEVRDQAAKFVALTDSVSGGDSVTAEHVRLAKAAKAAIDTIASNSAPGDNISASVSGTSTVEGQGNVSVFYRITPAATLKAKADEHEAHLAEQRALDTAPTTAPTAKSGAGKG